MGKIDQLMKEALQEQYINKNWLQWLYNIQIKHNSPSLDKNLKELLLITNIVKQKNLYYINKVKEIYNDYNRIKTIKKGV
jgi:hypothetical protein